MFKVLIISFVNLTFLVIFSKVMLLIFYDEC